MPYRDKAEGLRSPFTPSTLAQLAEPWATCAHKPLFIVFLGLWLAHVTVLAAGENLRMLHTIEPLFLISATLAILGNIARRMPSQNVLVVAGIVGGAACVSFLGRGDACIGTLTIPTLNNRKWFGTIPFALPLIWIVNVIGARGSAEFCLRPWRGHRHYGFWLMGVASVLATAAGAAWQRYVGIEALGSFIATAAILALCVPSFIDKRGLRPAGDSYPLVTWTMANVIFLMTNAA